MLKYKTGETVTIPSFMHFAIQLTEPCCGDSIFKLNDRRLVMRKSHNDIGYQFKCKNCGYNLTMYEKTEETEERPVELVTDLSGWT